MRQRFFDKDNYQVFAVAIHKNFYCAKHAFEFGVYKSPFSIMLGRIELSNPDFGPQDERQFICAECGCHLRRLLESEWYEIIE